MRIASAEMGGTFWTQALALKAVFEPHGLGPVEIVETKGASVETAERLGDGSADLGLMAANWVPRAVRGEAPFAAPIDLAAVAPMNAGPLFFIARAQGPIRAVPDLAGKRVVFGPQKSGMAQHAQLILGLLKIETRPVYLDFAAGGEALEAGTAEAQLQCPIPNRVMTELDARMRLRVLPYGGGQIERLLAAVPYYRPVTMPKGGLKALDRDEAQVGVLNLLVVPKRAAAALIERVARVIATKSDELGRLNPLFAGLPALFAELKSGLAIEGVPWHEGARAAYRSLGLMA